MNKYSNATETIKERVTFREVAERYGLEFNRAGVFFLFTIYKLG